MVEICVCGSRSSCLAQRGSLAAQTDGKPLPERVASPVANLTGSVENYEAFMEALAHFRSGGAGKGHDEHAVEGKSSPKKVHDSFDQHSGFSRSRRSAN